MQANLRPLSFGEILDGAFTLYRRNFASFAGTALVSALGLFALLLVLGASAAILLPFLVGGRLVLVLAGLLAFTAFIAMLMLMWGALAWRASQAYTGTPTTMRESLAAGGRSAVTLVGVAVAAALLCFVGIWAVMAAVDGAMFVLGGSAGTATQVVLGIIAIVAMLGVVGVVGSLLFATLPAVVLEKMGPIRAVSRSFALVEDALPRVMGVLLVATVISTLPGVAVVALTGGFEVLYDPASAAVNAAMESQSRQLMEDLLGVLVNVLTAPFLASVVVLLYYDRRVRTEALDVRMAADRLAAIAGD